MTFKHYVYLTVIYTVISALITVILQYPFNRLWELILR